MHLSTDFSTIKDKKVNNIYNKILFSFICLSLLMSSCSKEEYVLDLDSKTVTSIDTIIVEDRVVLNTSSGSQELTGVYTQCLNSPGIAQFGEYTHILAYAKDLVITDGEATYDGPFYLLYWTSSNDIEPGEYLVEGIFNDVNSVVGQENSLYQLSITAVDDFSIVGEFTSVSVDSITRSGEFSIGRKSCAELELEGEEFAEYADGRMTLTIDEENERLLMAVAGYCDDAFDDKAGQAQLLFGGGAFYLDDDGELTYDEDPELIILFDIDEAAATQIGQNFKAYYLDDIDALINSPDDPNYAEFIAMSSVISVTVTSESLNYLSGTYVGILNDGRVVGGNFRANITRAC